MEQMSMDRASPTPSPTSVTEASLRTPTRILAPIDSPAGLQAPAKALKSPVKATVKAFLPNHQKTIVSLEIFYSFCCVFTKHRITYVIPMQ